MYCKSSQKRRRLEDELDVCYLLGHLGWLAFGACAAFLLFIPSAYCSRSHVPEDDGEQQSDPLVVRTVAGAIVEEVGRKEVNILRLFWVVVVESSTGSTKKFRSTTAMVGET